MHCANQDLVLFHLVQSTGFRREDKRRDRSQSTALDETGRDPHWLSAHGLTGRAEKKQFHKVPLKNFAAAILYSNRKHDEKEKLPRHVPLKKKTVSKSYI